MGKCILVTAKSGRMLATCLQACGYQVLVIDCFADVDTQALSSACIRVESLIIKEVSQAFFNLSQDYKIDYILYGSGLESYPETLDFLHTQSPVVLGNQLNTVLAIQNSDYFFSVLDTLHIPFPSVLFSPPAASNQWLIKPLQREGGIGITQYSPLSIAPPNSYWQQYIEGISMSALWVANGQEYTLIGFNRQLVISLDDYPFIFSGIIHQTDVALSVVKEITGWLDKLVPTFQLKGLNTIDFIVQENNHYLLEINPRPSASLPLYHHTWIQAHIDSCLTGNWQIPPTLTDCRGIKIIYATRNIQVKDSLDWPEWVSDIPPVGTFIHTTMPICSIIADGKNQRQVFYNLLIKEKQIKQFLS